MLANPLYDVLPLTYLLVGSVGVLSAQPMYAFIAAITVFLFGAYIYNQRSINRRTDPKRKRKKGFIPNFLYGQLPFLFILSAGLLNRFYPKSSMTLFAVCLVTFGLYLLLRRSSFRQHKYPVSSY